MALHLSPIRLPRESDAFGRVRVSDPVSLFDSKSNFDSQPLLFDDAETSGSGTGTSHSSDKASVSLSVGNTTAGTRVRQSFRRLLYQPGKSQLCFMTFSFGASATGITRRAGLFDDENGVYLEQTGSEVAMVLRSSVTGSAVNTRVLQAAWSEDSYDDLDLSKSQIFVLDFEWLGVGTVRVGFVIDGVIRYAHSFHQANSISGVYMSTPNLPVRWEIDNDGTGGAATLEALCSTVISEGGQTSVGLTRSIDTQTTALSFNSSAIQPILAVRLKSTAVDAAAVVERFEVLATSSGVFRWVVLEDPSVVGTALSFSSVAADSILEVARPTSATTVTGGFQEASGYKESTNSGSRSVDLSLDVPLGSYIDGTPQIYVFGVQRVEGTGTETVYAAVTMREQV